ncbi:MAG: hypothetical protein AAGI07_09375 [Bacteroidota bacterium]
MRAFNNTTPSNYSEPLLARTAESSIAMPTNLTVNGYQPTLTWEDNADNEQRYKVERDNEDSFPSPVIFFMLRNAVEYQDSTAIIGNTYFYRVAAITNEESSNFSNTVSVSVTATENTSINSNLVVYPIPAGVRVIS